MIKVKFKDKCNQLKESGYSIEEEAELYERQLQDILDNLGWYLNNSEKLAEYRVRWKWYSSKTPTIPYKYTKKQEGL